MKPEPYSIDFTSALERRAAGGESQRVFKDDAFLELIGYPKIGAKGSTCPHGLIRPPKPPRGSGVRAG